jgi:hypothetical protein
MFHNYDKPLQDSDVNFFSSYSVQLNDIPQDQEKFMFIVCEKL